jgi:hypothetical protein
MSEIKAYDLSLKKKVNILQPEVVITKNGKHILRGISAESGKKVSRIISKKDILNKHQNGDGMIADLLGFSNVPLLNFF